MKSQPRSIHGDPRAQTPGSGASWCNRLQRRRLAGPALGENLRNGGASTLCVHAGTMEDATTGAVGTPIFQNSTFVLGSESYQAVEQGFARDRFLYSRYGNPNQWAVQEKLAALEGAESSLVFSSGMAAIAATVLALLEPGGHLLTSTDLYGGSYNFFQEELANMGRSVSFVDPRKLKGMEAAIRPNTELIFVELLSNPLLKVADLPALAALASRHRLRLVVDATFVSPIGCRPLEHGADLVVHSASKYLNGHSDLIAGAAIGSRKLVDRIWQRMLVFGSSLDPHACFLLERGLKTLALRMEAHHRNAFQVASFLQTHPKVRRVLFPGLESHPDFALAKGLLSRVGGMITFEIDGTDEQALALVQALKLPTEATSLGGVESLVSLPFNTSHAAFTAAQREAMGIRPGCVRLSVGIEDPADLIGDLNQALESALASHSELA
ncbi:MAG: aminotransferase class I/II-fold pyridoxal phosphate-dependent enzyme [Planctomycetota bacterium]|nr:MAG: aminotransferase class I/II-fold pyridoxal phosphate-dependent enzyme [Planctomycetota bacterium]